MSEALGYVGWGLVVVLVIVAELLNRRCEQLERMRSRMIHEVEAARTWSEQWRERAFSMGWGRPVLSEEPARESEVVCGDAG